MKKITDEMIMDLADGNLSDDQAKKVIKFLKTSTVARKKYEAFVKTSADFGVLNPKNDSIEELPSNIQTIVNKSRSKTEKKFRPKSFSLDFSFLDNFKNFVTNFRTFRNSLGIAVASLMIGIFGTNIYLEKFTLNEASLITRSAKIDEFSKQLELLLLINDRELLIGETIKNNDEISLSIIPIKSGNIILKFIDYKDITPIKKM